MYANTGWAKAALAAVVFADNGWGASAYFAGASPCRLNRCKKSVQVLGMTFPAKIREWRGVDAAVFRNEIRPANQPAVLKGLVRDWPAVQAGRASAKALCDYLMRFDRERPFTVLFGPAAIGGYFFYRDDMSGLNFERRQELLAGTLSHLLSCADDPHPARHRDTIDSGHTTEYLPGFAEENTLSLLEASAVPRIWLGNAVETAAHFDPQDNIACVIGGRRCFTVFPPDQISNLYVGPLEFSPGGTPVSMVNIAAPDLERFPRFQNALERAQTAELEPGDAIYIPYMWWHHVRSLEPFNVLINYWWNDAVPGLASPLYGQHAARTSRNQRAAGKSARGVARPVRQLCVSHAGRSCGAICRSARKACSVQ